VEGGEVERDGCGEVGLGVEPVVVESAGHAGRRGCGCGWQTTLTSTVSSPEA
jgi:hypothetical protein